MKTENTVSRMDDANAAYLEGRTLRNAEVGLLRRRQETSHVLYEGRPSPKQSPTKIKEPAQEGVSFWPSFVASGVLSQVKSWGPESLWLTVRDPRLLKVEVGRRAMRSLVTPARVGGEGSGRCPVKHAAIPDTRSQPACSTAPMSGLGLWRHYCSWIVKSYTETQLLN